MKQPILPPTGTSFGDSGRSLKRILLRDCNLVVWNRHFPEFLDWWLSVLKWGNVSAQEFNLQLDQVDGFELRLRAVVDRWCTKSADFNNWFTADVTDLARRFIEDTGAEEVVVKISPLNQKTLENVVSDTPLKLICNYGPKSLQWLPLFQDEKSDDNFIDVEPLDILVLKGMNWPGRTLSCISHRLKPAHANENGIFLEIEYLR